jgi:hypothetical protein
MKTCRECGLRWNGGGSRCIECHPPKPVGGYQRRYETELPPRLPFGGSDDPPSRLDVLSDLPLIDLSGVSAWGIFWRCLTLGTMAGAVLAVITLAIFATT